MDRIAGVRNLLHVRWPYSNQFGKCMLTRATVFPSQSSTFNILPSTSFNDTNGDGPGLWYSGEYAQDILKLNGNALRNFTFAIIEDGSEFGDDCIGLGDKVDEAIVQVGDIYAPAEDTLLTYAVSKGLIQTTAYSIFFDDSTETLPTGQILLGGVDAAKIEGGLETLATTVVTGTNTSQYDVALAVSLESLSFSPDGNLSNQKSLEPFQPLLVHPGTYSMWLPPNVATTVWTALGASYDTKVDPKDAVPIVPCSYLSNSTTLNLHFASNITIPVPVSDLTIHNGTGLGNADGQYADECKLDIIAIDPTVSFNGIGIAALKYMYTVYDLQNNEISIGLRGGSSGTTNVLEIGQAGVPALSLGASSTSTATPTPTPASSKSHALYIGLGVGIPLGVVFLVSILGCIAGFLYFRHRRRRTAAAEAVPVPVSDSAEKVPADAPAQDPYSTSPPTSPPQPAGQFQNTPSGPHENPHELLGSTIRYSELSGITALHSPHSPQSPISESPPHTPRPTPYEGT
jgi:hypothetical protein